MADLESIQKKIIAFRNERDWAQSRGTAREFSLEDDRAIPQPFARTTQQRKEELADIFIFLTYLSEEYKFDLFKEAENKIAQNAVKYPVEKAKGSSKKYTEL